MVCDNPVSLLKFARKGKFKNVIKLAVCQLEECYGLIIWA